ncbi:MAG: type IV pilus twitching motility protein PilT [Acidiferrobacterales bacterium]
MAPEGLACPVTPEPLFWTLPEFDKLLVWAADMRISDVKISPGMPLWVRLHGKWRTVGSHIMINSEIMALLDTMSKNRAASATVQGAHDYDFAHEIEVSRGVRQRYRGNATGCRDGGSAGIEMTLRGIPGTPPTLAEIEFPIELLEPATPANGLVLVTGVMGSGKSATLSALLRWINENQPRAIATYEAPIEYVLGGSKAAKGPVAQTQIPNHFSSFAEAARNAARRAEDIILVGESRDRETLQSMIEAADIGSAVYSTLHTRSVAESPARIINIFPAEAQPSIAAALLSSLRLIVQQRLSPRLDPETGKEVGRIALREWLVFDATLRDQALEIPRERLTAWLTREVRERGYPLLKDAAAKHNAGLIPDSVYKAIAVEQERRSPSEEQHGLA